MPPLLVDYHIHALGHDHFRHAEEDTPRFLQTALERGIAEVGFADHDRYHELYDFVFLRSLQPRFPRVKIRIGVEVDFHPGEEARWSRFLAGYPLDYAIGSVHDLGDWTFDHPNNVRGYDRWDPDELYRAYFLTVQAAVRSRLFSLIGHLDLIKVFGHRSRAPAVALAEETLRLLADHDQCIEINTNGWHKPVGEVYPSREILRRCFELNIPITLSSDAHEPGAVGRDVARAAELAREVGYRRIATFEEKKRRLVEL